MDFEYTEEQNLFRKMAREFCQRHVIPIAKEIDREDRFPKELVKELVPLGLLGIISPREYGGLGADRICYCVVLEELAQGSAAVCTLVVIQNSFAEVPILEWGNEEQKKKYLPRMIKGEIIGCLGVTEPNHGSDPASMETAAVREGNSWIINGSKMFISQGDIADVVTTGAQTQKGSRHAGIIAFIVERGMPGFRSRPLHGKLGLRGTALAELIFENLRIPDENVLGKVGDGFKVLMSAMDDCRVAVAATSVGLSQAAIEACINYAQQRQQFGKVIGSFQLIQAMIADMIVETEAARLLTYKAAALMDKGRRGLPETSYCKLYASEVAQKVAYNAIQIHGASGYFDDYPLERIYRDARAQTIVEGTSQIHRLIIGRHALGISAFV